MEVMNTKQDTGDRTLRPVGKYLFLDLETVEGIEGTDYLRSVVIAATGPKVKEFRKGQRVALPLGAGDPGGVLPCGKLYMVNARRVVAKVGLPPPGPQFGSKPPVAGIKWPSILELAETRKALGAGPNETLLEAAQRTAGWVKAFREASERNMAQRDEARAAHDEQVKLLWDALRDGVDLQSHMEAQGFVCPDCKDNPLGYYRGEFFVQEECKLCGRVGEE